MPEFFLLFKLLFLTGCLRMNGSSLLARVTEAVQVKACSRRIDPSACLCLNPFRDLVTCPLPTIVRRRLQPLIEQRSMSGIQGRGLTCPTLASVFNRLRPMVVVKPDDSGKPTFCPSKLVSQEGARIFGLSSQRSKSEPTVSFINRRRSALPLEQLVFA